MRVSKFSWLPYAAVLLTACIGRDSGQAGPNSHSFASEEEEEEAELSSGSCGVERWAVKVGTDSAASQVNLTPQSTTIAALRAIPVPSGFGANSTRESYSGSPELQAFKLTNVTLVEYKMETDSDYHLVLQDGTGNTMIGEIAYPGCASGSRWLSQLNTSRSAFDAKYAVTTSFTTVNAIVTVTGVGFFDVLHGQTGVAPNGIELHSILSICWGTNCSGGASPDFSLSASPASVSGSGTSTVSVGALNGFTGSVSLSASGVPSGATASLSPTSVSGSGSSTLTLTPGSAAAGTYSVTVTGTSGSLSHTTSISWTIAGSGGGALTNSGFESGLSGWTSAGSTSVSTTAHSGAQSAQVGSTSPGTDSSIAQTFTLPSNATGVSFWAQIHCNDTITYDWATATLKDNTTGTTTTILAKTCTNTATWVQASAAATGGHSVTLTLSNHDDNNAGDPTYTLYDDVAITTAGGGDTTPPTTSVTAPTAGSTVSGNVTVTATATDNVGVTKIELYADGALISSGTASPFSASWNSAAVANGAHSLTSKAYDAAGNVGTSSAVPVTVSNGAVTNPVVNPGFETGTLSGWTSTGTAAARLYPHTGSYAGSLGSSTPSADSTLAQTFTIPAAASTLSVWFRVYCPDTLTYDWATATLHDNVSNTTTTVIPPTCNTSNTWVQASVPVTAMRGHSVTLTLTNHDDNATGDATYTDFDDINVQ